MSIRVVKLDKLVDCMDDSLKKLSKAGLIVVESNNRFYYCAGRGVNKNNLKKYVKKLESK